MSAFEHMPGSLSRLTIPIASYQIRAEFVELTDGLCMLGFLSTLVLSCGMRNVYRLIGCIIRCSLVWFVTRSPPTPPPPTTPHQVDEHDMSTYLRFPKWRAVRKTVPLDMLAPGAHNVPICLVFPVQSLHVDSNNPPCRKVNNYRIRWHASLSK